VLVVQDTRGEGPAVRAPRRRRLQQLAGTQRRAAGGGEVTVDRGEEQAHGVHGTVVREVDSPVRFRGLGK
jgi:hypothetical protein